MPRLVLAEVHRRVARTASRMVSPSGRCPACPRIGAIASALAAKSSYFMSLNGRPGETFPGFGALASSRQAIEAREETSDGNNAMA